MKPAEIPLVFIRTNTTLAILVRNGPATHIFTERARRRTFSHFTFFDVHFKDAMTDVHGNGRNLNKHPLIRIKARTLAGGSLSLNKQLTVSQLKETVLPTC